MPRFPLARRLPFAVAATLLVAASALGQPRPAVPATRGATVAAPADASIFTDPEARRHAEAALDAANDLRFADVEPHVAALEARMPGHPGVLFLRAQPTWWRILLDLTNSGFDATFFQQMNAVVDAADARLRRNRNDFDARFFRGVALGYKARLHVNRSRWWPAARDGKDAYDDVMFISRRHGGNADFAFGRGLYDYYADFVRDRYPLARPVLALFPNGNRERGLAALRDAAARGTFTRTEATYSLAQILYVQEGEPGAALDHVRQLRVRHPGNAYFAAFEGRLYMATGQYAPARSVFEGIVAQYDAGRREYVGLAEQSLFMLARVEMAQGQTETALTHLDRVEALTARFPDGQSYYRVLGRLRRGMVLDRLDRRDEAVAMYEQVLRMRDLSGSHDAARRYLNRPYGS